MVQLKAFFYFHKAYVFIMSFHMKVSLKLKYYALWSYQLFCTVCDKEWQFCTPFAVMKQRVYILVRAECVRCPWLLVETKVATILGIFLFLLLGVLLFKNPEGVVVGFQIFAWAPN